MFILAFFCPFWYIFHISAPLTAPLDGVKKWLITVLKSALDQMVL